MFFSTVDDPLPSQWKVLDRHEQIEQIVENSFSTTQVIFKHSVTCGISAMAKHRLEHDWETEIEGDFYYLDLLTNRSVSNAVAEQFGVVHQSPQIILIRDGMAIDKVSHHAIQYHWVKDRLSVPNKIK